ncbi:MAG: hypothetical protein D6811_07125 [Alphaproteobacteria bacterium]|nr:MAG: hypothetical protein D6811_07125 [Alphaproteobacteria bacterium]
MPRLLPALLMILAALARPAAAAGPRVVVDIPPLAALVAMVAGEDAQIEVLLAPGADPHHAALRPSQLRRIAAADVAITLGEAFAPGIARAVTAHGPAVRVVLPNGADHGWLDPATAGEWLNPIAAALGARDRDRAAAYARRAIAARARLAELRARLRERLAGVARGSLASGHDAYSAFARAAGLGPVLALADHEDSPPGAARMAAFTRALETGQIACILAADAGEAQTLSQLAEGRAKVVVADILGHDLAPGPDAYAALILRLADTVAACAEPRP